MGHPRTAKNRSRGLPVADLALHLARLAIIVRGADTDRLGLTPQSAGLHAVSLGLSRLYSDDLEMVRQGLVVYDALYAWCCDVQDEPHGWPQHLC
jgi:hypothetical protein